MLARQLSGDERAVHGHRGRDGGRRRIPARRTQARQAGGQDQVRAAAGNGAPDEEQLGHGLERQRLIGLAMAWQELARMRSPRVPCRESETMAYAVGA
jgi:hypothetical protein